MYFSRAIFLIFTFLTGSALTAQEDVLLTSREGAAIRFAAEDERWRWVSFTTPGRGTPQAVVDHGVELATEEAEAAITAGWTLVEATAQRVILEAETEVGISVRRIFSFGPASNVLRMETWVRNAGVASLLTRIGLLAVEVEGETFRETGAGPASFPLFGESVFVGLEHVSAEATTATGELARLAQRPRRTIGPDWELLAAAVVGWTAPGIGAGLPGAAGLREAFLHYLDTVRIKPDRIVLHTDTWWTIPQPLTEAKVLADIEALRQGFLERTGMFFDTYCVDLGWSHPRTFWDIDRGRFPNDFRLVTERLHGLGAQMGLWMSPGSGYTEGLDNGWLQSQGHAMTPNVAGHAMVPCFALGGRYQREFKERVVAYAQQNRLGHVILDFMAQQCDVASHGHPVGWESRYAIDAGLADVLDSLRAVNPAIALEPMVCGYPPSPWWLMKTPFVLGPAGDDLPYGRVPCPDWMESLVTARDVAYRAGQEYWLMPTQALETFDIIVQTPGEMENMAVMAVGRGRAFLSTYFKPELMSPARWDFVAALVRWARQNRLALANAWQFGGLPEAREAYGFMFRNPGRDLYCVRNPWIEGRSVVLPPPSPATEARVVRMIYPRRGVVGRMEAGSEGLAIDVAPYETVFLESVPAAEADAEPVIHPPVAATLTASAPKMVGSPVARGVATLPGFRYQWNGVLEVPAVTGAELCVLVEGEPEVSRGTCTVTINGKAREAQRATSVGQFGAAMDASPENWVWFLVPLEPGQSTFQLEVTVPAATAAVSVYVRGFTEGRHNPSVAEDAGFPLYRPERRAWSQVLAPAKTYSIE